MSVMEVNLEMHIEANSFVLTPNRDQCWQHFYLNRKLSSLNKCFERFTTLTIILKILSMYGTRSRSNWFLRIREIFILWMALSTGTRVLAMADYLWLPLLKAFFSWERGPDHPYILFSAQLVDQKPFVYHYAINMCDASVQQPGFLCNECVWSFTTLGWAYITD